MVEKNSERKAFQSTFIFRCATQCERMPFVLGDARNVDENVIAGPIIKVRRSLDDQVNDFRW